MLAGVVLVLPLLGVAASCPGGCSCQGAETLCRGAGLGAVPADLAGDTVALDLSANHIPALRNNELDSVPLLRRLSLSDSGLRILEPEVFKFLEDLEMLDLHNNNLDYMHSSLFETNANLTLLDLSGNRIKNVELDGAPNLKFLNLSNNALNSESLSAFSALASLETLDVSNNQIDVLDESVFLQMSCLTFLDLSGNSLLEYDCALRTLWRHCSSNNIACVTDDEQSWRMLENLNCDPELPEVMALTEELLEVNETTDETSVVAEGSGSGMGGTDVGENPEPTDERTDPEVTDASQEDWSTIGIAVGAVCGVVVVVVVVVFFVCRRIKALEESSGNLSRTNSIGYINQTDEFNTSYHNSRNGGTKPLAHYDNVVPSESNRNILQFQVGDNVSAEVVRVPSFKTRGISTPLNLPTEVSPEETGLIIQNPQYKTSSLSRPTPVSTYEQNTTVRAGSLKRYRTPREVPTTNSRFVVPEVRNVPSLKRK